MYYLTNQSNQVIAADNTLLESLNLESIDDLIKQIFLEEISFSHLNEKSIKIITSIDTFTYNTKQSSLSSMLGNLNLIHLKPLTEEDDELNTSEIVPNLEDIIIENKIPPETIEEELSVFDDDLISIKDSVPISETQPISIETEEGENDLFIDDKNELFDLSLPDENDDSIQESIVNEINEKLHSDENELFELILPESPKETIDEIILPTVKTTEIELLEVGDIQPILDTSPIIINVKQVSESIGISAEDYDIFLNEYIDAAISFEQDLHGTDSDKRSSAIDTLTQLADTLQLPEVNEIMEKLSVLAEDNLTPTIELFYSVLSRLTTHQDTTEEDNVASPFTSMDEEDIIFTTEKTDTPDEKTGFGTINLDNINPIHFDFQLEAAANDLSLPVALIEEFVHDFIEQAHTETKKMLSAHEEGDLDSIQKIGHMLKGASSNLRINALSDTLYDIQFCEDSSKLEELIKRYWAHFLSFEQQIDMISN